MTKDELISKQQLDIENQKIDLALFDSKVDKLNGLLFSIGAPLNDNILLFSHKQKMYLYEIAKAFDLD